MTSAGFDLDVFLGMPRVVGLGLSPDGRRLVATVQRATADGKRFAASLWDLDPDGVRPARRLTRSGRGEALAGFLPDGSILFVSARTDPEQAGAADEPAAALWVLAADGGEARRLLAPPGGVEAVAVARDSGTVVAECLLLRGAASLAEDEQRTATRTAAGIGAVLFDSYPMRYWDRLLGPTEPRLVTLELSGDDEPAVQLLAADPGTWPGARAETGALSVTPDGSTVVLGRRRGGGEDFQSDLVAIGRGDGEVRLLARIDGDHSDVACSPDGRWAACLRIPWGTPEQHGHHQLLLVDLASGESRTLAPQLDRWAVELCWAPDSSALLVTADENGHTPIFRVGLDGEVTRLVAHGHHAGICPAPDGRTVFALRSSLGEPPHPVALDTQAADQEPRALPTPWPAVELPGRVEELTAVGPDGSSIHSWLMLPTEASGANPAPLAVFIHGGPFASQSGWHWRWNPALLAARGYAVLLPDPALSTGYGSAHIDRSWGDWARIPAADILAAVDAALERPDLDASRTAALGGSYGGYMVNWLAGHTDRFRCLVTHASVWAMDQMFGTTDFGPPLARELGDPYSAAAWSEQSPHRSVAKIRTPMLVIHGERDARVPISEGIRLWTDLRLHGVEARFLYFPDENHWVLKPNNSRLWYQTVLAFLDEHVLGHPWQAPDHL